MDRIKIKANPYKIKNEFLVFDEEKNDYIIVNQEGHPLLAKTLIENHISSITDDLLSAIEYAYYTTGGDKVLVEFEGTDLDFKCLEKAVKEKHEDKVTLIKNEKVVQDVKKSIEEFKKSLNKTIKILKSFNDNSLKEEVNNFVNEFEKVYEKFIDSKKENLIIDDYKVKFNELLLELTDYINKNIKNIKKEIIKSEKLIESMNVKSENIKKELDDLYNKFEQDIEDKLKKIKNYKLEVDEIAKIEAKVKDKYDFNEWKKFKKQKDKEIINTINEKIDLMNKEIIAEAEKKYEEHKVLIVEKICEAYFSIVNPYKEEFKNIFLALVNNNKSIEKLFDELEKSFLVDYQDILNEYKKSFENIEKYYPIFSKFKHVDPFLILVDIKDTCKKLQKSLLKKTIDSSKEQVLIFITNSISNICNNIENYNIDIVSEIKTKENKENFKLLLTDFNSKIDECRDELGSLMVFD